MTQLVLFSRATQSTSATRGTNSKVSEGQDETCRLKKKGKWWIHITLWLFNIAMENGS